MPDPSAGVEVASVFISKQLTDDDYQINYETTDEQGDNLSLVDTLGMLEFAKMAIIRDFFADDGDPDEDDEAE